MLSRNAVPAGTCVFLLDVDNTLFDNDGFAADLGARCYDRFMHAVADIAAEGRLRLGDADSAAHTLWAACHGLVSLRTGGHHKSDLVDDETLMALMLDSLFQGLVID